MRILYNTDEVKLAAAEACHLYMTPDGNCIIATVPDIGIMVMAGTFTESDTLMRKAAKDGFVDLTLYETYEIPLDLDEDEDEDYDESFLDGLMDNIYQKRFSSENKRDAASDVIKFPG